MIADVRLDPERTAALDFFVADIEALHASHTARDAITELLASALCEPSVSSHWGKVYRAVSVLLAGTSVEARSGAAYHRLQSFLAENSDLDTGDIA